MACCIVIDGTFKSINIIYFLMPSLRRANFLQLAKMFAFSILKALILMLVIRTEHLDCVIKNSFFKSLTLETIHILGINKYIYNVKSFLFSVMYCDS